MCGVNVLKFGLKMFSTVNLLLLIIGFALAHDLKGFDDAVSFKINWPGNTESDAPVTSADNSSKNTVTNEVMRVTTADREQYDCQLPTLVLNEPSGQEEYYGPSPLQLLNPLLTQKVCSYRLESYWSYELCHGRYIRQYHEEREGKKVKIQEYYLGKWTRENQLEYDDVALAAEVRGDKLKYLKIDGLSLPYIELVMDDGTVCDLNGKPRVSRVQYVCYIHGKHEVYSFKETSTCEYEIVILSPFLCAHPRYRPQETSENLISCVPVNESPKKPKKLLAMEAESHKLRQQKLSLNDFEIRQDVLAVLKLEKSREDGETRVQIEIHSLDEDSPLGINNEARDTNLPGNNQDMGAPKDLPLKHNPHLSDDSPVRSFLDGETCLNGGTGWWRYEFCYGKRVEQYHIDRNGARSTVLLGEFHEEDHLEWIANNPNKSPKPIGQQRTSISHFYSRGTVCDKTGKPRQTEVKLKCLENSSSPGQVSLYLLEPKTCQYILGVESPLICDILHLADDRGLIKANSVKITDNNSVAGSDKQKENKTVSESERRSGRSEIEEDRPLAVHVSTLGKTHNEHKNTRNKHSNPLKAFLSGENCLIGGSGWWRYRFCYGKNLEQFHIDLTNHRTSIILGEFHLEDHVLWLSENPHNMGGARGVPRTSITHFFSRGTPCEQTGIPRQTEVQMGCLKNAKSTNQVSLYLLEPEVCQYILSVKTPIICDILNIADDFGLVAKLPKSMDNAIMSRQGLYISIVNDEEENEENDDKNPSNKSDDEYIND